MAVATITGSSRIDLAGVLVDKCGKATVMIELNGSAKINCDETNCKMECASFGARCIECGLRVDAVNGAERSYEK